MTQHCNSWILRKMREIEQQVNVPQRERSRVSYAGISALGPVSHGKAVTKDCVVSLLGSYDSQKTRTLFSTYGVQFVGFNNYSNNNNFTRAYLFSASSLKLVSCCYNSLFAFSLLKGEERRMGECIWHWTGFKLAMPNGVGVVFAVLC